MENEWGYYRHVVDDVTSIEDAKQITNNMEVWNDTAPSV